MTANVHTSGNGNQRGREAPLPSLYGDIGDEFDEEMSMPIVEPPAARANALPTDFASAGLSGNYAGYTDRVGQAQTDDHTRVVDTPTFGRKPNAQPGDGPAGLVGAGGERIVSYEIDQRLFETRVPMNSGKNNDAGPKHSRATQPKTPAVHKTGADRFAAHQQEHFGIPRPGDSPVAETYTDDNDNERTQGENGNMTMTSEHTSGALVPVDETAGQELVVRDGSSMELARPYEAPSVLNPLKYYRHNLRVKRDWELAQRDAELDAQYEGVVKVVVDDLGELVVRQVHEKVAELLPPAIRRSPAAPVLIRQAQIQSGSHLVAQATPIEKVAADRRKNGTVVPNLREHERSESLLALPDQSVTYGIGEVFVPMSRLEAAERTAAALCENGPGQNKKPLVVHQFSKDGRTFVDALLAAEIVEEESLRGGSIPGRSDEPVKIIREGFDPQETFKSSVGMIQDRQNPEVTMVFALEPGMAPMAGHQYLGQEQENFGLLEISAVGVIGRPVDRRMNERLNEPTEAETALVGTAGLQLVTEVRRRTDLTEGVRYLTDPQALGLVKPRIRRTLPAAEIEAGPDDIVDAETLPDDDSDM